MSENFVPGKPIKEKIETQTVTGGFFKITPFDNGSFQFAQVVDGSLMQAFSIRMLENEALEKGTKPIVKCNSKQNDFLDFAQITYSRASVQDLLNFCVRYLELTGDKKQ